MTATPTVLRGSLASFAFSKATLIMFILIIAWFSLVATGYFSVANAGNIVKQSSFIGIAAVGMTFVLLTAGIDLSVGSVMYLAPVVAGYAMREFGLGVPEALALALVSGAAMGMLNATLIVWLGITPFIVTLSTLFLFRGAGTFLTKSMALDFPREMVDFGLASLLGVPLPIVIFVAVAIVGHVVLTRMPFGRQLYAIGNDPVAGRKAGLKTGRITGAVYVISSTSAALAGFVLIAQIGRLDQSFGEGREFDVIAAAVLGGTSLFGGVGTAFGAVFGALFVQVVTTGMVFTRVNLYMQPIVLGGLIFAAVLADSLRRGYLARLRRRGRTSAAPDRAGGPARVTHA